MHKAPLDIDGELAQHLKRLSRKDPTTKLKALTALSTLLKEKSAEDVSPIISRWAFEYKKLLQDYNREVRRATHDTMATLVSIVGSNLAPHLKSLIGPWWFSQFDPVHYVSQAAKQSFQAAFPAHEKRLAALMLYTDAVFTFLEDNLKLTPQRMSDKAVASDELQEMHQQVISTSLLALAALIDILMNKNHGLEKLSSRQKHTLKARSAAICHTEKLFSVHKCVDFLKFDSCAIRSATYSLVESCVKNVPRALNEADIKILEPAILGAFQEKVPTCHSSMWEAVLIFSRTFPESWSTLIVRKTFLNRFWYFLRHGCFGSQLVSYPTLVLFLDCIPPMATTMDTFFLEFFQNFWAGKFYSQSSNADRLAFFQSYRECFLWVLQNVQRYCDGVEAMHQFQRTIIDEVLLKLIWHDYLLVPSSEQKMKNIDSSYQVGYVQEFGKCITEILSGICSLAPNLLSDFCLTFEEHCLDMFQQSENIESCENVDKIIRFLQSVDLHAVRKGDLWPLSYLVGPVLSKLFLLIQTIVSKNHRVAAFVDKLISKVGIARVVAGSISSEELMTCHSDYPRAWLASEMLCTWEWQGGSVLTSFLPSLIQYTKSQASVPSSDNLLDSIVNILIDGAINIQGANSEISCSSIIYCASYDQFEGIENVFLRALVLILHTLFDDNIWGRSKALGIFNLLVDRLFLGEVLNSNCLKILVVVMSVLIEPLFQGETTEENEIHDVFEGWIQKTLDISAFEHVVIRRRYGRLVSACCVLLPPQRKATV